MIFLRNNHFAARKRAIGQGERAKNGGGLGEEFFAREPSAKPRRLHRGDFKMNEMSIQQFQEFILQWHKKNNRDYLPWRQTRDPYKIFVSEVMLQQTQVSRVREKYPTFLKTFPTVLVLATASLAKVLKVWQGMGYNRRARYLKEAAADIVKRYQGNIPDNPKKLMTLPGIGAYSAGAVACFAFNKPVVFFDTNIRKVFIHFFFQHTRNVSDNQIKEVAGNVLYKKHPRQWYYALMDYGAIELSGRDELLAKATSYRKQSFFEGSPRYFRSKIMRHLLQTKQSRERDIQTLIKRDPYFSPTINVEKVLAGLQKDRLIVKGRDHCYYIGK